LRDHLFTLDLEVLEDPINHGTHFRAV
jgi:hypothetical protein